VLPSSTTLDEAGPSEMWAPIHHITQHQTSGDYHLNAIVRLGRNYGNTNFSIKCILLKLSVLSLHQISATVALQYLKAVIHTFKGAYCYYTGTHKHTEKHFIYNLYLHIILSSN
jgi:hypothetical protein